MGPWQSGDGHTVQSSRSISPRELWLPQSSLRGISSGFLTPYTHSSPLELLLWSSPCFNIIIYQQLRHFPKTKSLHGGLMVSALNSRVRGIEWSLRAFASMQAVCLFLKAWAVINFAMRALRKFSARLNLSLLQWCFAPSNLADTFKTGQQPQS